MSANASMPRRRYEVFVRRDLDRIGQLGVLGREELLQMKAVSAVLPFRTNSYVVDELIRWDNVPDDPIYQLTFPQPGMLAPQDLARMVTLVHDNAPDPVIAMEARAIQQRMNPHPAGQRELNVPEHEGHKLDGVQHKYRETVLFFPRQGQTCHAYCTYCFRWAQFVGIQELRFAAREVDVLQRYLAVHPEVTSVLFTGGDPLVMRTSSLRRYIEPLLGRAHEHLISIRIGTKALAYWPERFLGDPDADDLLRLFEQVRAAGKQLALMAHYTHPRELETPSARAALQRVVDTGAIVRCQAPLVRHVNDAASTWADLWRAQLRLGAVPYYMFVERDTGPKQYFEVPLARALPIFRDAYRQVSGLGRTVRGPVMSTLPGKVQILGDLYLQRSRVFVLEFLQARDPDWVGRPFLARWNARATWLDDLQPALGEREFFFEPALRGIQRRVAAMSARTVA